MISSTWLDQRTPYWRRLEALLDVASRVGLGGLTRSDLQELGLLYRQIAADLATVRDDPGSARFAASLNRLLARAHHTIYAAERPTGSAILRFVRETFPRAVRRNVVPCAVAFLLFLGSAAVGAALTRQDPDFKTRVLSPAMIDTIARREMWTHSIVAIKPVASSAIMTNNVGVAFTTFAAGITAGVGTVWMLLLNGLLLGVIGVACAESGLSLQLWSFVAPHGVLELPSIFIAGGAGLRLAQGLLVPGFLPRLASVARAGREAVKLVAGCVPILVVAGVIEAFVSPTDLAVPLKFGMAGALFAGLWWYLAESGRSTADSAASPANTH